MQDNFDLCFSLVVGHEGGFTNDRHDRGNWTTGVIGKGELKGTNFGISAMAYPDLDIAGLKIRQAKFLYRRDYWDAIEGDYMASGLDLMLFDAAVNQGPERAIQFVQRAAGVSDDGVMGPITRAAINKAQSDDLLAETAARRMHHYMLLDHLDDRYGLGWSRRLINIYREAMAMRQG